MNDSLNIAAKMILNPANLTENRLNQVISNMLGFKLDAADIYFQTTYHESWMLEDSEVKQGSFSHEQGVGVRAISGEKTGFAYSDDIEFVALEEASRAARCIAKEGGQSLPHVVSSKHKVIPRYDLLNPLQSMPVAEKLAILRQVDSIARQLDKRIVKVDATLAGLYEVVLIINHEGLITADVRPLVRLNISVIAEEGKRKENGYSGGGGRYSYQTLCEQNFVENLTQEAVKQALVNLNAIEAPAGVMPVVLGPGWPGVLLHEAVGHGLEGDFNRKELSAFSGRIGQRVAAPGVTVVDDGTLQGKRGSLTIDDEGTPTQRTILIEDGILKGYMCDRLNAKLLGMKPTGNGRRESYAHIPMPRMTNTFMLAGNYNPEEIISTVKKGIYAVNFGGGQVDITSGKFVFSTNLAYLIEDGKVTKPIKRATLIGHGPEVLKHVTMIGQDLKLDTGVGVCGKDGQSIPVGVGQPTLKIDKMTVGGTQA